MYFISYLWLQRSRAMSYGKVYGEPWDSVCSLSLQAATVVTTGQITEKHFAFFFQRRNQILPECLVSGR